MQFVTRIQNKRRGRKLTPRLITLRYPARYRVRNNTARPAHARRFLVWGRDNTVRPAAPEQWTLNSVDFPTRLLPAFRGFLRLDSSWQFCSQPGTNAARPQTSPDRWAKQTHLSWTLREAFKALCMLRAIKDSAGSIQCRAVTETTRQRSWQAADLRVGKDAVPCRWERSV